MFDEPDLLAKRLPELERLLAAHLATDSLDEANATVFDDLIDVWLDEELTRLELADLELARATAAARTWRTEEVVQPPQKRWRPVLPAAIARRKEQQREEQEHEAADQLRLAAREDARRTVDDELRSWAGRRLAEAEARFRLAEQRLIGEAVEPVEPRAVEAETETAPDHDGARPGPGPDVPPPAVSADDRPDTAERVA